MALARDTTLSADNETRVESSKSPRDKFGSGTRKKIEMPHARGIAISIEIARTPHASQVNRLSLYQALAPKTFKIT